MDNYFDTYQNDPWINGNPRNLMNSTLPTDFGPNPFVVDIKKATEGNDDFRRALWTGDHLQLTLMNIPVKEDIGKEMHPNVDQFLRVEEGVGLVQMGDSNTFTFQQPIFEGSAIFIPAGTFHNITNTGNTPLKLYSIYAPANHPKGTIHKTKADAKAMKHSNK